MPARRPHAGRSIPHPRLAPVALLALLAAAAPAPAQPAVPAPAAVSLCAPDLPMPEVAARASAADAPAAETRRAWATSDDGATRRCGLRALAATRDRALVAALEAALARPEARDDAWMLARWAAFAAGGPDADASAAFAPLVDVLAQPAVAEAADDDGVRLLGEIASPAAVARLRTLVALDRPDHRVDAAIHGLARQGEASMRDRIAALGHADADGLVTNATYEQARRIGVAAFYLLALGADTRDDGMRLLTRLAPADQADAAAWAVQTLCERGVRRPAEAATIATTRAALIEALDARGIAWASLTRGAFACPAR